MYLLKIFVKSHKNTEIAYFLMCLFPIEVLHLFLFIKLLLYVGSYKTKYIATNNMETIRE